MHLPSRFRRLPLTVRALLVVATLLAINQAFAVYMESAVAASFGWPLVFLTAAALLAVVLDGLWRGLRRLAA